MSILLGIDPASVVLEISVVHILKILLLNLPFRQKRFTKAIMRVTGQNVTSHEARRSGSSYEMWVVTDEKPGRVRLEAFILCEGARGSG